jgi:hypothetical protein
MVPCYRGICRLTCQDAAFSSDASQFLNDQSDGLYPGWITEYRAVAHDIAAFAHDCGITYHYDSYYLNHK